MSADADEEHERCYGKARCAQASCADAPSARLIILPKMSLPFFAAPECYASALFTSLIARQARAR
jgi:hypothetical protein